jgi:hypothetical protein
MSESQLWPDDVARYTSQIVAAYCERNGVDTGHMQDVAVAISKALVGISASSPTQKAKRAASTAGVAEPQGAMRFADQGRRARSEHLGSAPVHAGGAAALAVPARRRLAMQPGHPNRGLEPNAVATAASACDQLLSELRVVGNLPTMPSRENIASRTACLAQKGEDDVARSKKAGMAELTPHNVVSLALARAARPHLKEWLCVRQARFVTRPNPEAASDLEELALRLLEGSLENDEAAAGMGDQASK